MAVIIKGSIGRKQKSVKVTSVFTNKFAKTITTKKPTSRGRPTGFKVSQETKDKISAARLGHSMPQETKDKISESLIKYNGDWRDANYSKHWVWVNNNDKKALRLIRGEL